MPPIAVNRRRFLGCSAAASLALRRVRLAEGTAAESSAVPVRLGLIGIGTRGTALLRTLLELPGTPIIAVCDPEPKHRLRGQGIVEKARGHRPEAFEDPRRLFQRADIDAVVAAVPCDLHESMGCEAVRAGKHLYAEKPLALTLTGCDRLAAAAAAAPGQAVHVGFQRRSNPRFVEGVSLIQKGELGPLAGSLRHLDQQQRAALRAWRLARPRAIARETSWSSRPCISGTSCTGCTATAHQRNRLGPYRALCTPRPRPRRHRPLLRRARSGKTASAPRSCKAGSPRPTTASPARPCASWAKTADLTSAPGRSPSAIANAPVRRSIPGPQNDTRLALSAFLASVRAEQPLPPPITLAEARAATLIGAARPQGRR